MGQSIWYLIFQIAVVRNIGFTVIPGMVNYGNSYESTRNQKRINI